MNEIMPRRSRHRATRSWLTAAEVRTLDALIAFLSTSSPFFPSAPLPNEAGVTVAAVCGNWYDVPSKMPILAEMARTSPSLTLLLSGGRDERLTLPEAKELGGEPLYLQAKLFRTYGIERSRQLIWSGARITNHNLRAMLFYAKQTQEFEHRSTRLQILEQGFLVRRLAASMRALLDKDPAAQRAIASLTVRAVGPMTFDGLVALHGGHDEVAFALIYGELKRLTQYSVATNDPNVEVVLSKEAGQLPSRELGDQVQRLWQRNRDGLYASGLKLLANRTLLSAIGAVPV